MKSLDLILPSAEQRIAEAIIQLFNCFPQSSLSAQEAVERSVAYAAVLKELPTAFVLRAIEDAPRRGLNGGHLRFMPSCGELYTHAFNLRYHGTA